MKRYPLFHSNFSLKGNTVIKQIHVPKPGIKEDQVFIVMVNLLPIICFKNFPIIFDTQSPYRRKKLRLNILDTCWFLVFRQSSAPFARTAVIHWGLPSLSCRLSNDQHTDSTVHCLIYPWCLPSSGSATISVSSTVSHNAFFSSRLCVIAIIPKTINSASELQLCAGCYFQVLSWFARHET